MWTDEQRQNAAFKKLVKKWHEEGNFANGYYATLAKEYRILARPLKKRFEEYLAKGYDISIISAPKGCRKGE